VRDVERFSKTAQGAEAIQLGSKLQIEKRAKRVKPTQMPTFISR
jgi:hypothetical protein